jgi:hypothetical protein
VRFEEARIRKQMPELPSSVHFECTYSSFLFCLVAEMSM